jgi:hypothetical protein
MFKLKLTSHFQTYLLSTLIVLKSFKSCNHLTITQRKYHAFIMLFKIIFNLLSFICVKNWTIF